LLQESRPRLSALLYLLQHETRCYFPAFFEVAVVRSLSKGFFSEMKANHGVNGPINAVP